VKFSVLLVVSLVAAIGGSLFLSGVLPFVTPKNPGHAHTGVPRAEAATLPLHVIERFTEKQLAGDAATGSNMKVDENFVDPENHCEFCTRVEYIPGSRGLAGFAYSSDDALDLTGAKKIKFWVMGEDGGEKVKFKLVGKKKNSDDRQSRDSLAVFSAESFGRTSKEISLKDEWIKYEVDLEGSDLTDITHPFGFELSKGSGGKSQVVYLKGVVLDDEPVESEAALATTTEEVMPEEAMTVEIRSNGTSGDTSTSFRLRSDVSGGERPYDYRWDLDDGTEERGRNTIHSFDEPGTYNVTLLVTDDTGLEASGSIEIEVEQEDEPEENDGNRASVPRSEEQPSEDRSDNATESQNQSQNGNATGADE
jgi:PKD repeat protein